MKSFPGVPDRPTMFGPKLITKLLVEEGLTAYSSRGTQVRDIHLCPTEVFYPYAHGENFHPSCITPDTLAVHVWSHTPSWNKDLPAWVRLAKSVRKRLAGAYSQPVRSGACGQTAELDRSYERLESMQGGPKYLSAESGQNHQNA